MIVDAHTHIHDDPHGLGNGHDASLTNLLRCMDKADVEKALIMAEAVDVPYIKRISNETVARACSQYPDRLIGFASVHPLEKNCVTELRIALDDLGLRGLKLHPRFQGVPADDPRCIELATLTAERNLPIAVDAFLWKPTPLRIQLPLHIDTLCKQVPGARIITNHAGGFHFLDALAVAIAHDNVWLEFSTSLAYFINTPFKDQFLFVLKQAGPQRVIFGSDHPQKDMTKAVQVTREALQETGFSTSDLDWAMGKTFLHVLSPQGGEKHG